MSKSKTMRDDDDDVLTEKGARVGLGSTGAFDSDFYSNDKTGFAKTLEEDDDDHDGAEDTKMDGSVLMNLNSESSVTNGDNTNKESERKKTKMGFRTDFRGGKKD